MSIRYKDKENVSILRNKKPVAYFLRFRMDYFSLYRTDAKKQPITDDLI